MNKQELIDKAVHEFKGVWPVLRDHYMYMSYRPKVKGRRFYPFYVTGTTCGDYQYWHISEFEQRAKELGYIAEPSSWYDYTTQKAVALPPVGDKSISYLAGDGVWIDCEIAAYYGGGAIVAHNDGFTLVYKHELRPNNFYARLAEQERKRVVDAAMEMAVDAHMLEDILASLYDAGFLKMPDDKNG